MPTKSNNIGGRGGARPGAGRKKKPLQEKLATGNPGKRELSVLDFSDVPDVQGVEMPRPHEMLSARQRDGKPLQAEEIYRMTWQWLEERNCAKLVSPQVLERYAMCAARWIQCEECISEYGFLAKHPTTGNAIASPYVAMSQTYMKQVNQIWYQIFQVVKENCSVEWQGGTPQDDVMERLLRTRRGM